MLAALPQTLTPQVLLRASIVVALLTIALKGLAWWITQSVGLLSDAMESLVNLASAAFALLMVTIALRPADAEHPYGHSKAEYFAAGFEGLMIIIAALGIAWAGVQRLLQPQPITQLGLGLALSVLSSALNGGLAWLMLRSARLHRSMALEGDARHLLTDVWTSAGVLLGVGLVALTGWQWLDAATAIAVALNILREGAHLMWKSSQGLMDEALPPEVLATVQATLAQFQHRSVRFDHVISRGSGARRFVALHMHVPAEWTLGRAAAMRGAVERALMDSVPGLRATIELLPTDVEAHAATEEELN
ncbi:cation diffusion facilitator family transporter [uncultured Ramlibacter sp.]|uniref:cation diffusion facilitator family transporter n=1 Tax=uncultured Ramlibacter sp. TaxID=260755 RepID=UPI0026148535|nr:cation diffusion facilitator family transporter [uncultured Ramlibacter sp.]